MCADGIFVYFFVHACVRIVYGCNAGETRRKLPGGRVYYTKSFRFHRTRSTRRYMTSPARHVITARLPLWASLCVKNRI